MLFACAPLARCSQGVPLLRAATTLLLAAVAAAQPASCATPGTFADGSAPSPA
jgi:hypothetical protein